MKKTLLSLFTVLGLAATAQTLNQGNHSFIVGDAYTTIACGTVGIAPGSAGTNQTWNFSTATTNTASTVSYLASANTNTSYPSADIYLNGGANNSFYYKSTSTDMKYYGGAMSVNGTNVNLVYTLPAVYATYPMNYNTTANSSISGNVVILGNTATFTGQCNFLADATGTITLPSGMTYSNTIRVLTTQTITTSPLPFVGVATINLQNYDYYDPSTALTFKAPLFSISTSTLSSGAGTSVQTFVNVLKDNNVGIRENKATEIELSVFPNPASTFVNFSTSSTDAVKIVAFDVTGKIVATETVEMGKAKMNTSNLTSGVYVYSVLGKDNQTLKTGKFNVTK
jgi:hypothetical protein